MRLWDAASGALRHGVMRELSGHDSEILALAVAADGRTVASASMDNTVKLWDPVSSALLQTLTVADAGDALAFAPDGTTLATADGRKVVLWDPRTGSARRTLDDAPSSVTSIAFSPDGKTLAVGSADGSLLLWPLP